MPYQIKKQGNNTRRCHVLTFNGKTMNITQWSEKIGVPRARLSARINAYGWSVERALTTEKRINGYG